MNRAVAVALVVVACCCSLTEATAAILIHDYQLTGNFDDELGGPSLVPNGGTINATNYTFDANQGLALSNGFGPLGTFSGNYSILINFTFHDLPHASYRKIIDFQDLTSDNGLYIATDNDLSFLDLFVNADVGLGTPDIVADIQIEVALTRDASSGIVTGYVNGIQQFTFLDLNNDLVFGQAGNIAHFFKDDAATSFEEASSGQVDRIRIYGGALTADEALNPPAAVPEPVSLAIWSLGGLGCAIGACRRRRVR